ncbi:MAG: shikimate dehydrogenase [Nitrosopumilaceae archaeon]|nr:shikimate dehydrogenase [Nitrosopumilaceae archaeon]NIU00119.1 shikimate dehydrogenase [Nitrosopumilaceae archaeon]NIU86509.1 shikimate dehydrogenase [Nitrosopumilaceae archaeon]NIV65744.1 shikimate dehydrogenase [Nitrosopumilaceae archaeon]NIX60721.1 shikimate dehydrogenase [Nitrosopumilaceae archaeon]
MVKTYAVIGDPIDHSLSPLIHNAAFRELEMDCSYIAYRIPKYELAEGIVDLKKVQIAGFNVTIPHKVEIMRFLDKVDESCSIVGASNTVVNQNGLLKGYNTDMDGFLNPIKKRNIGIKGSKVLLLGAGGAARAIIAGFSKEKASEITIANRTLEKGTELAEFAQKLGIKSIGITLDEVQESASEYNFIINSTSIGLNNEPAPISLESINKNNIVYDVVYSPMNTNFIKKAKEKDATIVYGYEMLLGQAALSFEIWHEVKAPYDVMKKALLGGF